MNKWISMGLEVRWVRALVAIVASVAAVLAWTDVAIDAAWLVPSSGICRQAGQDCTSYRVARDSVVTAAEWLDDHEGAITAIATVVLAVFTWRLWLSTRSLWKTTNESVNLARDEFESTHRPRIRIKHVWLSDPLAAGAAVEVNPVIVNVGDLPARLMRFDVVAHPVRDGETPPNDPFLDQLGEARPGIGVEEEFRLLRSGIPLDMGMRRALDSLDAASIERIWADHSRLYCFGYVEYTDNKETTTDTRFMRTSFCRVFQRSRDGNPKVFRGAFVPCNHPTEHEYQD